MNDEAVLDGWWRHFVATGEVPGELERVQGRLVRAVHRGRLASGEVYVKTMTFPRLKDRVRYALRALPAAHEAAMLQRTAAAGIPCPPVVAVRTARRSGLPHRSMLVLRGLPVSRVEQDPVRRSADEVETAARLLDAGILHRDLHGDNFLRLLDGRLAVIDLQSARASSAAGRGARGPRLAVAARFVRERQAEMRDVVLAQLREVGILRSDSERARVLADAEREAARFARSRVRRCLSNSTEFERRVRFGGVEYRVRGVPDGGRWWPGRRRELAAAWLGQRVRQLDRGAPLFFGAFFRKWWWLGGGAALYVAAPCSDERIEVELRAANAAGTGRTCGPA